MEKKELHLTLEERKKNIIKAISACDNPYLLGHLEYLLEREASLVPLSGLARKFPLLLEKVLPRDTKLKTNLQPGNSGLLGQYEKIATPLFFYVSLFMLIIIAAIVNAISLDHEGFFSPFQSQLAKIYWIGWFFYLADFLAIIVLARKTSEQLASSEFIARALVLIFPPIRLASRHIQQPELVWIPYYRWSKANEGLLKHIKEKFSIPMIVIALLIIPVLVIEWKFYDEVSSFLQADLSFILDMVQAFIWLAFAFEFILMISISNEKIHYTQLNWIDVLIILLPFISFVRTMRIIKIARLSQLARGYKLRALLMKARQGLIFASFFRRILSIKPDFQIKKLKKKLDRNQKEREAIEEELMTLYAVLNGHENHISQDLI
ncbi:hypothetical protein [Negadavirga shengliensis]|uniref:Potassium channel protein n=1 Tax=Negadavirga shengliensis TaxID=1389218 RepID=A0ABV9T0U8_9BACT